MFKLFTHTNIKFNCIIYSSINGTYEKKNAYNNNNNVIIIRHLLHRYTLLKSPRFS